MLPNLIIIGAMKCGTTSLHYYLGFHPQIQMSAIKELDFFVEHLNWRRGIDWYTAQFYGDEPVHGEASQHYTNYPQFGGVPARIHSVIPDVKLIYIMRDPVERIISHYMLNVSHNYDTRDIVTALTAPDRDQYLDRSKYYMQLEQYLQFFPRANLLLLKQEDLLARRHETMQAVFRFLNVDETFSSPEFTKIMNPSTSRRRRNWFSLQLDRLNYVDLIRRIPPNIRIPVGRLLYIPFSRPVTRPIVPEWLRLELKECLRDDLNRLRALTGWDLAEWKNVTPL